MAKATAKAQEHPAGGDDREGLGLGQLHQVERDRLAGGAAAEEHQREDADQHQGRAEHRVDEELHRRVGAVPVPPFADEEVHRHQHELEEDEEREQVERQEHAHAGALQQQQPGEVGLGVVLGEDRDDRRGGTGSRSAPPGRARCRRRPRCQPMPRSLTHAWLLGELEAGVGAVEVDQHPHADRAGGAREQQGELADELGPGAADQQADGRADDRAGRSAW